MSVSLFTNVWISHLSLGCRKWAALQPWWNHPGHISVKKRLSTHWKYMEVNPPDIYVFDLFQQDMIKMSLGKFYCWWTAEADSPGVGGRFSEHWAHRFLLPPTAFTLFPPHIYPVKSQSVRVERELRQPFPTLWIWNPKIFIGHEAYKAPMSIFLGRLSVPLMKRSLDL